MSHDIRTPMNAIIGLTHLAKDETDLTVIHDYLYNIESSSDFLLGLINDILDMSKIENGDLKLKEDIFTREDFADSISTVIAPLMEAKKINFHFSMEGTVDFIIRNLPAKGDLVGLQFTVKDTGTGMSPEVIPHMYDPFSQERSKLNDSTKGTGLGLPMHWKIRKRRLFWPV